MLDAMAQQIFCKECEGRQAKYDLDCAVRQLKPEMLCVPSERTLEDDDGVEVTRKVRDMLRVINPEKTSVARCAEALERNGGSVKKATRDVAMRLCAPEGREDHDCEGQSRSYLDFALDQLL